MYTTTYTDLQGTQHTIGTASKLGEAKQLAPAADLQWVRGSEGVWIAYGPAQGTDREIEYVVTRN